MNRTQKKADRFPVDHQFSLTGGHHWYHCNNRYYPFFEYTIWKGTSMFTKYLHCRIFCHEGWEWTNNFASPWVWVRWPVPRPQIPVPWYRVWLETRLRKVCGTWTLKIYHLDSLCFQWVVERSDPRNHIYLLSRPTPSWPPSSPLTSPHFCPGIQIGVSGIRISRLKPKFDIKIHISACAFGGKFWFQGIF